MKIKITSHLTAAQSARLRKTAAEIRDIYEEAGEPMPTDFAHVGRNLYAALDEGADAHAVARRMMTVAGTTFEYEWSDGRLPFGPTGICVYCGRKVEHIDPAPVGDDLGWAALAEQHMPGCEWIATRAHRVEEK